MGYGTQFRLKILKISSISSISSCACARLAFAFSCAAEYAPMGLAGACTLLGKAGGDDGHAHLVLQLVVERRAEDDVRFGIGCFHDDVGGRLDIVETEIVRACDIDENAGGAVDGRLEQRAGDGSLRGLLGLVAAGGGANAHVGLARVAS